MVIRLMWACSWALWLAGLSWAQETPPDGMGWATDPSPLVWESSLVQEAPQVDGVADEAWSQAKPLTVQVREALGGDHPKAVELRALHCGDMLYVLARWADATPSSMRDPYVWNPETKQYDRPSRPDDQFALEFPIRGDFGISMLTVTREYTADVWHWKAGRGNPIGWVDDKFHVISQKPIDDPKAAKHDLHGGRTVYILRKGDAGTPAFKAIDKPTDHSADVVDSFAQQEPTGSAADVRGKAVHDGTMWTLEMCRKFDTAHEDDAVIDPSKDNPCAIAVLDDELYEEHSVSTLIHLRFVENGGRNGDEK